MSNEVEFDSQSSPTATVLLGGDPSHRESGAKITLEQLSRTEWVLAVKLHGSTIFTYKPPERKISMTQVQMVPIAAGKIAGRSNRYAFIWSGTGQDWRLEFTEKKGWIRFGNMHEECYNRNQVASSVNDIPVMHREFYNRNQVSSSVKDIPVPIVREIDDYNLTTVGIPFERPMNYIKTPDDQVRRALASDRIVYDMESDDEEWLRRFNSSVADSDSKESIKIAEDALEEVIDKLEKAAFLKKCDCLTVNDALEVCSGSAEVDVLTLIHSHWIEKRKIKGTALVQEFQISPSKRGKKHRGNYFTMGSSNIRKSVNFFNRQRPVMQHSEAGTSKIADNSDEEAEAAADLKVIRAARSARENAAVDLKSTRTARREAPGSARKYAALDLEATTAGRSVKDAIRAALSAREYAAEKRAEAERLMRVADLATYKAVKFTNEAELISAIEKARSLGCDNAENFSSDITEKLPTDEASTSNPSSQMRTSPSSP